MNTGDLFAENRTLRLVWRSEKQK